MPKYRVSLSDGRTFEVEASAPPSEQDVMAALGGSTSAPSAPATPAAKPDRFDTDPMLKMARGAPASELWQRTKDNPAKFGAQVGAGLLGGGAPRAIVGMLRAALGGAGGAGFGIAADAARRGPSPTMGDDAKTMARDGGLAALGEGVGRGVMAVAKAGGKLLYRTALRPSMGLQREFGDVAETGLREGAPVSDAGLARTGDELSLSADKVKRLIADAEAAGAPPVTTREVASEFGDVFQQGRRQAQLGKPDPRPPVVGRLRAFDARNPNGIPLTRAQELKGEAQDLASRAYRAEDLGNPINDLSAASDKAMARGLRQGIETRVPEVGPLNQRSQELIGLERALEDATRRNVPGVGSVRTLLGDFAPNVASRAGIGFDRAGKVPFHDAFRTALLALLGQ